MKRILTMAGTALYLTILLAGCGGSASSQASSQAAASSSLASSAGTQFPASSEAQSKYDLASMVVTLSEAAQLGTTIELTELDLTAGGINMDNIAAWAGADSQLVVNNGGTVIVIQAQEGKADAVVKDLEAFKTSRMDDRYADFAEALANTKEARILSQGDIVIYAVSAAGSQGGYADLDAALQQVVGSMP